MKRRRSTRSFEAVEDQIAIFDTGGDAEVNIEARRIRWNSDMIDALGIELDRRELQ